MDVTLYILQFIGPRETVGDSIGKDPTCECRRHKRHRLGPYVGKIPWRRRWQPTPVLFPGESSFLKRGAWKAIVHEVAKRQAWLKRPSTAHIRPLSWAGITPLSLVTVEHSEVELYVPCLLSYCAILILLHEQQDLLHAGLPSFTPVMSVWKFHMNPSSYEQGCGRTSWQQSCIGQWTAQK